MGLRKVKSDSVNHGSLQVTVIRKRKAGGDPRPDDLFKKVKTGGKANAGDSRPEN